MISPGETCMSASDYVIIPRYRDEAGIGLKKRPQAMLIFWSIWRKTMITIWNQMEVYTGPPTQEMISVKNILDQSGIKYKCRLFSQDSAHFLNAKLLSLDFFGLDDHTKIHVVYVHKRDFEAARALLANQ